MYIMWTGILKLSRLIIRINLFLTEQGQAEIAKNNACANYLPMVDKAIFFARASQPLQNRRQFAPSIGWSIKRTQQENEREEKTPK